MGRKKGIYEKYIKRLIDIIGSLVAIIVLSPILLILTIAGTIKMKGNPFFVQPRVGKDEKVFNLIKFRTMTCERDKNGNLLPDEERLNSYGGMLRKTSLDELGELFNILKGDMSIVGPRPLVVEYIPFYKEHERKRHSVRPGLTGLAQVNGRSFLTWEEIFTYDVEYVNNITFIKDMRILLGTVQKVLASKDIADLTESRIDENGDIHFIVDGKDYILHQPLNVERSR